MYTDGRRLKDKGVDDCRALERIYDLTGSKWNVGSELEYFHYRSPLLSTKWNHGSLATGARTNLCFKQVSATNF